MIINKIFASSWYFSSFQYTMHGHTYIKLVYFSLDSSLFALDTSVFL